MSTGKTEHIQLNQWEAQDDFLREEFNEDNRRIDSAITALREELREGFQTGDQELETALAELRTDVQTGDQKVEAAVETLRAEVVAGDQALGAALGELRYVTLLDVTTKSNASQVDLDVSGIDFTQYLRVEFYLLNCTVSTMRMRVNNLTDGYSNFTPGYNGSTTTTISYLCSFSPGIAAMHCEFTFPCAGVPVAYEGVHLRRTVDSSGNVTNDKSYVSGAAPVNWEALNSLNFYGSGATVPAGSRFIMLGVKR